jgi:DNA-binding NtrC family response regulator
MQEVQKDAMFVAPTSATVLLTGPSGVGKDVIARFIHEKSGRAGEMLAINCAAIPENLLESLLFGHERGVFTGAFDRQVGLLERVGSGTVLFDEMGCMPELLQAKLLRVLQEGEFQRLGSHQKLKFSARVIASTNEDLEKAIALGKFREDLYYRLAVFPICIPSLKSRLEDVPALFSSFIDEFSQRHGFPLGAIDRGMLAQLKGYDWPGNIRELRNAAEYVVLRSQGTEISLAHFPVPIQRALSDTCLAVERPWRALLKRGFEIPPGGLRALLRDVERQVITDILHRHGGILNRAYKELGIPKPTLIQRTRMLNIDVNAIKYKATL